LTFRKTGDESRTGSKEIFPTRGGRAKRTRQVGEESPLSQARGTGRKGSKKIKKQRVISLEEKAKEEEGVWRGKGGGEGSIEIKREGEEIVGKSGDIAKKGERNEWGRKGSTRFILSIKGGQVHKNSLLAEG